MESLNNMTTEQALRYLTREIYSIDSDGEFDDLVRDGINMLAALKNCLTFSGYRDLCNEAEDIIADITPKAECFNRFLDAKGSITLTEAAKPFGMTAQELASFLRGPKVKWLFRNMQGNNMPTKPTLDKGYMRVVTRANSMTGYISGQGVSGTL